jgi:hypothetical protein
MQRLLHFCRICRYDHRTCADREDEHTLQLLRHLMSGAANPGTRGCARLNGLSGALDAVCALARLGLPGGLRDSGRHGCRTVRSVAAFFF